MKCDARKPGKSSAPGRRRKRIRLYHLTSMEQYSAIKAGGFRGDVYCAEHPKQAWGADGREVLLEVFLDMDAADLERYRVAVKWEDPSQAEFDHYYRIPPEAVNATGLVRRVSLARRQRYRLRGVC